WQRSNSDFNFCAEAKDLWVSGGTRLSSCSSAVATAALSSHFVLSLPIELASVVHSTNVWSKRRAASVDDSYSKRGSNGAMSVGTGARARYSVTPGVRFASSWSASVHLPLATSEPTALS